ncbi:hypothetical protein Rsub_01290 [Raphidocelis subcapitata]|uniref:F-box domain-containing protein n=1 Tax=Raphidocelis subcapitata TaxID=307507 RepID=A0A2V0NUS1_9CHLO|nr:hypothetical protein Rsub_01290 [Raphidocelis subcapitata]|eukprot:GBF88575.1 hypothetical protein Rsub_01290 [Raphidocelis subcapitata]
MPAAAALLGWIAALLAAAAAWLAAAARALRSARAPADRAPAAAAGGRRREGVAAAAFTRRHAPPAGPPGPWQELPDAVFAALVAQLDPADAGAARGACRSWRAATGRVLVSLQPAEQVAPARLAAAFPSLAALDLSRCCEGGGADGPLEARAVRGLARLVHLRHLRLGSAERLGASPGSGGAAFLGDGPNDGAGGEEEGEEGQDGQGLGDGGGPAPPDAPVGFPGAGEAALCALPRLAAQLTALDLSGCVHAGDAAHMGISRLWALRCLRLRRCGGLTDAGLVAVALLPALTRLDVSECPLITNLGLRALARPPLEDLSISSCLLLAPEPCASKGDPGLPASIAHLTRLRRLAAHRLGDGDDGATLALTTLRPLSALSALTELSIGSDRSGQELRSIRSEWLETQHPAAHGGDAAEAGEAQIRLTRRLVDARRAAGQGVAALGGWLPRLRRLSVAACMLVAPSGDDSFAGLSLLGDLEDLRLTLRRPPTSSSCLERLSRLTRLDLDCRAAARGGELPRGAQPTAQLLPGAGRGGWDPPALPPGLESLAVLAGADEAATDAAHRLAACTALTRLAAHASWLAEPLAGAAGGGQALLSALRVLQLAAPPSLAALDDLLGCLPRLGALRALRISPAAPEGAAPLFEGPRALDAYAALGSLTGLESLQLGWFAFDRFEDLMLTVLTGLTRLTECVLDGQGRAGGGDQAQQLARLPALMLAHPRLLCLHLPELPAPAAAPRRRVPPAPRGARLQRLSRRGGPALLSCWEIAQLGSALRRLDLAAGFFLEDSEFAGLRELRRLTYLDIGGCVRLGDASLSVVAHHMPALAVLRAPGCLRLTDRGVAQLSPALAASLLELRLGGARSQITDAGAARLAALTCLTALQLRAARVTDAGLPPLTRLARLSALDLVGCGVTAEGVMALAPLTRIAWLLF